MKNDSPQAQRRRRTTIVIVAGTQEDFEWALEDAIKLARASVIHMEISKKGDPLTRYEVRTSKMRKVQPR